MLSSLFEREIPHYLFVCFAICFALFQAIAIIFTYIKRKSLAASSILQLASIVACLITIYFKWTIIEYVEQHDPLNNLPMFVRQTILSTKLDYIIIVFTIVSGIPTAAISKARRSASPLYAVGLAPAMFVLSIVVCVQLLIYSGNSGYRKFVWMNARNGKHDHATANFLILDLITRSQTSIININNHENRQEIKFVRRSNDGQSWYSLIERPDLATAVEVSAGISQLGRFACVGCSVLSSSSGVRCQGMVTPNQPACYMCWDCKNGHVFANLMTKKGQVNWQFGKDKYLVYAGLSFIGYEKFRGRFDCFNAGVVESSKIVYMHVGMSETAVVIYNCDSHIATFIEDATAVVPVFARSGG